MDIRSPNETRLISEILELHPRGAEVLGRYFGERFLQKPSLRILSLNMACILHGVNIAKLLDDLEQVWAGPGG